jgi:hypothetical protein
MSETNKLSAEPAAPARPKEISLEAAKLHVGSAIQLQSTPDAPKYA